MWTETKQTLQEIHQFVAEKPQKTVKEEVKTSEVDRVEEKVVISEETKINEIEKKETMEGEMNAPPIPPIVNNDFTDASEYVG